MAVEEIEGYNEFIRATGKIEDSFQPIMARASTDLASEWVTAAQSNTSTSQEQLVASMLRSQGDGDGATIECNSPMFFGVEFGGQGRPSTMQFPPYQGQRGYFFYPARRSNEERLFDIWEKGIDDAMSPWDRNG